MSDRKGYGFYDWARRWHFEENLPKYIQHMDSLDTLLDDNHKPSRTRMEQKNTFSFRTLYDGVKILNDIYCQAMVNIKARLEGPVTIDSYEEFKDRYIPFLSSLYNCDDVVGLLNHKEGTMKIAYSKLKNYYDGIDPQEIIDNLPDDFMAVKGTVSKGTVGSGTQAMLLTTKRFPVDGVEVKSSDYVIGPKVLKMTKGAIEKESFAKSIRHLGNDLYELTIEDREYEVSEDGKILNSTARNCYISYLRNDDGKFRPVSEISETCSPMVLRQVDFNRKAALVNDEEPYPIYHGAECVAITGLPSRF